MRNLSHAAHRDASGDRRRGLARAGGRGAQHDAGGADGAGQGARGGRGLAAFRPNARRHAADSGRRGRARGLARRRARRCGISSRRWRAIASGAGGRLSVGAVSTAKYFAPRLIAAFVGDRPKLELRFLIGNRDETIESLRSGRSKSRLPAGRPRTCRSRSRRSAPHPYVIIAPPDHRLGRRSGLARDALAGEAFLFREPGSGHALAVRLFHRRHGDPAGAVGMELGSNETIKQAVMAGLGIALISAHTIAGGVADGRLVASTSRACRSCGNGSSSTGPTGRFRRRPGAFRDFAVREGEALLAELDGLNATAGRVTALLDQCVNFAFTHSHVNAESDGDARCASFSSTRTTIPAAPKSRAIGRPPGSPISPAR